jgi:hypothetical protein
MIGIRPSGLYLSGFLQIGHWVLEKLKMPPLQQLWQMKWPFSQVLPPATCFFLPQESHNLSDIGASH